MWRLYVNQLLPIHVELTARFNWSTEIIQFRVEVDFVPNVLTFATTKQQNVNIQSLTRLEKNIYILPFYEHQHHQTTHGFTCEKLPYNIQSLYHS